MGNSTKKILFIILISLSGLFLTGFLSYKAGFKNALYSIHTEQIIRVIKDSSTYITPAFIKEYIHRDRFIEVPAWDTINIHHHDTTYIGVPYMEREYGDSTYYARVGGYNPELLDIRTFNTTKYITNTILPPEKKPFYVGVEGEFAYDWSNHALAPVSVIGGYDIGWLDFTIGGGYDFMAKQPMVKASLRLLPLHWK